MPIIFDEVIGSMEGSAPAGETQQAEAAPQTAPTSQTAQLQRALQWLERRRARLRAD